MKKFYYSMFAAATMLLATTSCSQNEELVQQSREMTTFKVTLEGAANSRTAGDGLTVNKLYYAVYDSNGERIIYPNNGEDYGIANIDGGTASVNIPLMKSEEYDIVFWAQNDEATDYSFTNLTEITVNYPADGTLLSNQENRDAFFNALDNFRAEGNTQTVYLKRPFAQLNVATSIDDWNEALRQYQANGGTGYPVKHSSVTIDELATTFNAMTGVAGGKTSAEVTFGPADLIDESIWIKGTDEEGNETQLEYKLLAMNYVMMASNKGPQGIEEHEQALGNDSRATIEVDFTLWKGEAQAENEIMKANVPFVPIQRNYRTNIIGKFLTGDQTQFNIVVDANFDNPDNNVEAGFITDEEKKQARIYNVEGLEYFRDLVNGTDEIEAKSFTNWTVFLEADIDLNNKEWTPIANNGKQFTGTFDGKNHTISNFTINQPEKSGVGFIASLKGTVKNVKIDGAIVTGMKSVGALVGTAIASTLEGNEVDESEVTAVVNATTKKDGNNAGGLIGYISDESKSALIRNTVSNVKVTAYADLGALAGTVNGVYSNLMVTGNKVSDCEVIADRTVEGEDKAINANEIVGRIVAKPTLENNKAENVTVGASVNSEAGLKDALQMNLKNITVVLTDNNAYDIAAWDNNAMGGENTETITIDGSSDARSAENFTLTFNNTNSDWNHITTKNGAKLILKNLHVTNSGHNDGPWNRHDLNFACDVEMENVTSDKAIALKAGGVLKNVTINDANTSDTYAIWIQPNGQEVTIENCIIDMINCTDGRGIKIDEQYVDSPEKVTLKVSGTTFKTEEKSAVLVKSVAGAEINWGEGNNISEVAADDYNAVWVDEASTAHAHLVIVSGSANKIIEGTITVGNDEQGKATLAEVVKTENALIQLKPGNYTFPKGVAKGVTIECTEGVVFEGTSSLNINGATVIGGTFSGTASGNSGTITQTINGTFKDCTFTGVNALRYCYAGETVVFENCVFDGSVYGVHFDGGVNEAIFKNCTFSGFNAFGGALTMLTLDGCTFKANGKSNYNGVNLWGSTTAIDCKFEFDGSVENEWIDPISPEKTYEFTNCTVNGNNILISGKLESRNEETVITVDGVQYKNLASYVFIDSKEGLFNLANEVNNEKNDYNGKTIMLIADIDLENQKWAPIGQTGATTFNGIFDGQNHTISNLNVDSSDETGANYSSGLFGWVESHTTGHGHIKNVKINSATITGHHNCGALVGYITQQTALVENCHVTNATISCTVANNDANGDKAGGLIGNATVATPVKNCTATNSTVSAGRDAGQVIGAGKEANVTGCSASEVSVTANGTGTGANIRNEVIGRLL